MVYKAYAIANMGFLPLLVLADEVTDQHRALLAYACCGALAGVVGLMVELAKKSKHLSQ